MVIRSVPGAELTILGSDPTSRVKALVGDHVMVSGHVSDAELREKYQSARVAVVPLRFGAGVKLKTVEALREGLPLVTTPVGAQGLPFLAETVSVCTEPSHFADEVCRLMVDDSLWLSRCNAQINYAREHFSQSVLQSGVSRILSAANVPMPTVASAQPSGPWFDGVGGP